MCLWERNLPHFYFILSISILTTMNGTKIILITQEVCMIMCALLLVWGAMLGQFVLDETKAFFISMFIIAAVMLQSVQQSIKWQIQYHYLHYLEQEQFRLLLLYQSYPSQKHQIKFSHPNYHQLVSVLLNNIKSNFAIIIFIFYYKSYFTFMIINSIII